MVKLKFQFWLFALGILLAVSVAVPANATTYLSHFSKDQYLMTKKTIHTTNSHYKNIKITIPKGTVLKSSRLTKSSKTKHPYLTINLNRLHWSLRKAIIQSSHNVTSTSGIWAKTSTFKKVHAPAYQTYFKQPYTGTIGRLIWEGTKAFPLRQQYKIENCLRVTDDGYLEYFTGYDYWVNKMPAPHSAAKVEKFVKKGKADYLYTASKVSGLNMKQVAKKGQHRYRLKITKTDQHMATVNPAQDKKYDESVTISIRYYVGGKKFYVNSQVIEP